MPHPEEEQLLRYSDGELPARASSEVRSHLEACWQCRTNLEELEQTVGACIRYRSTVLERHLPAPPAPWTDIYHSFSEIDASLDRASLLDRISRVLAWPIHHPRKWTPAAVVLLLITGLFYRYRVTPSVQAAELLQKAMVAADTHPFKAHMLRVRTKERSFTRRAGVTLAFNATDQETANSLKTIFHNANYNWDDPLSAKSYASWRDQLSTKQDHVIEEHESVRVRTDTESGDLLEATLQLKSPDLQPMEGRFEFRNRDWVEITALPDDVESSVSPVAPVSSPAPDRHVPAASEPIANSAAPIVHVPTVANELHVLAALHEAGADLGDPVEVTNDGGDIVVSGVGIAPDRQLQIQQALSGLPNVVVRFGEAAPASVARQSDTQPSVTSGENRAVQSRIAEQVGGRANFEQLAAQVLDMSDPLMSRVYALRRLMERFPPPVEAQLDPRDLEILRRMQREHTAALRQQVLELEHVLTPALKSAGGRGMPESSISYGAWQPATEELFQSSRRVEKLLAVMFGAAPADQASGDSAQLPGQLLSAVAELRAKVDSYDSLLAKSER